MTKRDVRLSRGLESCSDEDGFAEFCRLSCRRLWKPEMTKAIGAEKGERTTERVGYRPGYYERKLVTRVGVLELRVPQDRPVLDGVV